MKTIGMMLGVWWVLVVQASAGKPIVVHLPQACAEADLVVIGVVGQTRPVPEKFEGYSEWSQYGFSKCADVRVFQTLYGKAPERLQLYGGRIGAGTYYRLDSGRFLLLLKRVDGEAYRAVDSNFSFMRAFLRYDGHKVEWLKKPTPREVEMISDKEAKVRLLSFKKQSEQGGAGLPAIRPESKPEGGDKPQPEAEGRSR